MTQEPYASARRVFWVVDNGSSHAGQASVQRMRQAWPKAVLVHLPIHASWLNQIEIYFSIVQRKVVKPANFSGGCCCTSWRRPPATPATLTSSAKRSTAR